jgi:tetratricopeptide (TPR) repeat protein
MVDAPKTKQRPLQQLVLPDLLRRWLTTPEAAGIRGYIRLLAKPTSDLNKVRRALVATRWPGMHPELLPFAVNSDLDLYCLALRPWEAPSSESAVVKFSPETYTAVPVASSFSTFLMWLELDVWRRRRTDAAFGPALAQTNEALDLLFSLAEQSRDGIAPSTHESDPVRAMHARMVELDPDAAGSWLALAGFALDDGEWETASAYATKALAAFPGFAAAVHLQTVIAVGEDRQHAARANLFALARCPWVWCADRTDPLFSHLPPFEPEQVASDYLVSIGEAFLYEAGEDSVCAWIHNRPRVDPSQWIQASHDFEDMNDVGSALAAAANGLLRAPLAETALEAFRKCAEIYDAIGSALLTKIATDSHTELVQWRKRHVPPSPRPSERAHEGGAS